MHSLLRSIISIAGPLVLLQIFIFLPFTLTTIHLGNMSSSIEVNHAPFYDTDDNGDGQKSTLPEMLLSAFALSNLVGAVTGIMVIVGILSAFDTLGPQYMSLSPSKIGPLAVRSFIVCSSVLLPLVATWFIPSGQAGVTVIGKALLGLRQPLPVVLLTSSYLKTYSLSLLPLLLNNLLQRYLSCQKIVTPLLLPSFVSCCINHPLNLFLFVTIPADVLDVNAATYTDNSPQGYQLVMHAIANHILVRAAIAHTITYASQTVLSVASIKCLNAYNPSTLTDLRESSFLDILTNSLNWRDLQTYMSLALPGILSMTEWLYWEFVCFSVGTLGILPFAIHSVPYSLIPLHFMIPLGLSISINVIIGQALGDGNTRTLWRVIKAGVVMQAAFSCVVAVMFVAFDESIITLFTKDPDVIEGCIRIWPWVAVFLVGDGLFGLQSGILRGLGLQVRMSGNVITGLWLCGAPLIYLGGVSGDDGSVYGVWKLMFVPYVFMNIGMAASYWWQDFDVLSKEVVEREKGSGTMTGVYSKVGDEEDGNHCGGGGDDDDDNDDDDDCDEQVFTFGGGSEDEADDNDHVELTVVVNSSGNETVDL
jgi:MATE family multidrug resistance protein